jgi:hypothetical protein
VSHPVECNIEVELVTVIANHESSFFSHPLVRAPALNSPIPTRRATPIPRSDFPVSGCNALTLQPFPDLTPPSPLPFGVEHGVRGSRRVDCIVARGAKSNREIANQCWALGVEHGVRGTPPGRLQCPFGKRVSVLGEHESTFSFTGSRLLSCSCPCDLRCRCGSPSHRATNHPAGTFQSITVGSWKATILQKSRDCSYPSG